MREIKFRGKRLDNGEWVYGCGIVFSDDFCIIDQGNELYVEEEYKFRGDTHFFRLSGVMCDPNSVGQFTGLLDKNGKAIYEGDVVDFDNYLQGRSVVKFSDGNFMVSAINYETMLTFSVSRHTRIIGNIHDNPELLKHE